MVLFSVKSWISQKKWWDAFRWAVGDDTNHWIGCALNEEVVLVETGLKIKWQRELASKDGVIGRLRRSFPFLRPTNLFSQKPGMHPPLFKTSHMHTIHAFPGLFWHVWNSQWLLLVDVYHDKTVFFWFGAVL